MNRQLTKASSWRKDTVVIKGQSSYDYDFLTTKPNSFYVMNRGDNTIYIGIKDIPTKTRFEHRIGGGSSDVFGQPDGTKKLYFYNDSINDITIDIYSYDGEFDITVLKKLSVVVNGGEGESGGTAFDGFIQGFADGVSLPSGSNLLGRVQVQNPKEIGNWGSDDVTSVIQYLQNTSVNSENLADIETLIQNLNLPWTSSRIAELMETIEGMSVSSYETVAGVLGTKVFTPTTVETIKPDTDFIYFDRICYLRAIGGNFTFRLIPEEGMSTSNVNELPSLTLNNGDSLNDFVGRCYGIQVTPIDGSANTGRIEIVYSQK